MIENTGINPITGKKESRAGPLIYMVTAGQPQWSPRDYASFAKEGYVQNAIVYRCIRLIVDACASVRLLVYNDAAKPIDKHDFYDLIAHPNPFAGTSELMDELYSFLLIAGNSYLEAVLLGGKPTELYVLRPDLMKISLSPKGRPAAYTYTVGGNTIVFRVPEGKKQREILHLKLFHPLNEQFGLSPVEPAAFAADIHSAAGKFQKALLDNSARPSGALVVNESKEGDSSLTEEQFKRLKSELEEQYTGAQNAGRPLVLEGGLDWKPMSMTMEDLQFIESKNQAAREIALAYGVPPMLLGIPGDNTYSNYKEANVAFYRQTVLPLVGRGCQAITNFFSPTYGEKFRLWYDIDEIAGLTQEREDTWTRVNTSTVLSVDEKREAIGYGKVEGGDQVLIQSSLVPLNLEEEDEELDDEAELDDEGNPIEPDDDPEDNPEDEDIIPEEDEE